MNDNIFSVLTNSSNNSDILLYEEIVFHFQPAIVTLDLWVTPIWYIIGIPANIIAFTVWIQPRMRQSSGCYLAALAVSDFSVLLMMLLLKLPIYGSVNLLNTYITCPLLPVVYTAMQHISCLLVLGFTVERYISICHPFQRVKYCTTSKAVRVICGLFLLGLLLNAIQAYFFIYKDVCRLR